MAEGLILKSRCRWYEKGEQSNDYFLRVISRNRVKKSINKRQRKDGTFTTEPKEILKMQEEFNRDLYSSKQNITTQEIHEYLKTIEVPQLNQEYREKCEGYLRLEECTKILKSFKTNKCPGNDGFIIEFYGKFWPIVGTNMVKCFNTAYDKGQLTSSQSQAVITLLDKGKDRSLLANWRHISLLNTDYK